MPPPAIIRSVAPGHRLLAVAALALALAAAACRPAASRAGRIARGEAVVEIHNRPLTLDPSRCTDMGSAICITSFSRGLTRLGREGKVQPDLADSWQLSADGRTCTFHLRPARWSNGDAVTADDFVYTWTRRMLDPHFGSPNAHQLFYIRGAREFYNNQALGAAAVGVTALAPDRLQIQWAYPAPFGLNLVAGTAFFPVNARVDQANPHWMDRDETYVGCGPFTPVARPAEDRILAVKNPCYWDAGHVQLATLVLTARASGAPAVQAFDDQTVDAIEVPLKEADRRTRTRPEMKVSRQFETSFLYFNATRRPFDDPRVRRALAMVPARNYIIAQVMGALDQPAFDFVPPTLYRRLCPPIFKEGNLDVARRLMSEAGYPDGRNLPPLTLSCDVALAPHDDLKAIVASWQTTLGVRVAIEERPFKNLMANMASGNFEIGQGRWIPDFVDPISFLELLDSKTENNPSHFADPRYDALLEACRNEPDPDRRDSLLHRAEQYLMDQMPVVPICYPVRAYLTAPRLGGFWLNPIGIFDAAEIHWGDRS